jgi:hypothetical protein
MYFVRKIGQFVPWLFLLFYAIDVRGKFNDYIHVISTRDHPYANESFVDFIGLGIWPALFVLALIFLVALALAWLSGEKRMMVFGGMVATFLSISMADYFWFNVIVAHMLR